MISALKDRLPTMMTLAHEHTELARIQLAGMLADVFLHSDASLNLREEEMVNELIDLLMLNSTPRVRTQLIEKFVDVSRMPRRLATNLMHEHIDIARAVLVANHSLNDDDLIQVVERESSDHALAVAARSKISEAVADALVTTGDVRVMQMIAENLGAHLSSKAVEIVADAARYSAELRAPIMKRPEMGTEHALKLYWWVEQDLRRYALKRFGVSTGQIDEALACTISDFLDDHNQQKMNDDIMLQVVDWMEDHEAITPRVLPQVLRMGHFRVFNMLLAHMSKLKLSLIDTIVSETGGRGLASICRAVGIEKADFVSLFLLSRGGRPGEQIVHPRELSYALETFDRMTPNVAKDLLHSWDLNPKYFDKHNEEMLQEERNYY